MRPKKHETTEEEGLFRARSSHMKHELVQLAGKLDWDWLDGEISTATKAGPGLRLASSLGCCCSSTSSRYPMRRCVSVGSMTPISSALRPEPLEETPRREARASAGREPVGRARGRRVAHKGPQAGHGRHHRAAQGIPFPTDAKLLHAAIQGLNRLARRHGIRLRQSYLRIAKR